MDKQMTGGCQCGRVRYRATVHDDEAYLCHCRMCQRATGGVSIAFKSIAKADVEWEREPDLYPSSSIAERGFCSVCGTPLSFWFPDAPRMDLTVGSFDDPSRFRPVSHSGCESWHRGWLDTSHLPATRTDENQNIVRRWMEKLGRLPD